MLAFEASGIDHVGLIQICFSAEATVSRVCEKTVYLFRYYFYSISQYFTRVDKNPYNGEKPVWSMLDSLDQDIKHVHSNARSECNAVPEKSPVW